MTEVYMPLPYTPIIPSGEPRVLFKLGSIYQSLELGKEYPLNNPVSAFSGGFPVMVTGFYKDLVLVQCPETDVCRQAKTSFFSLHNPQDYRPLSDEEYYFLYPEERQLLPGRVIHF